MSQPYKRKNWIINPKLQYRLIALSGGFVALVTLLFRILSNQLHSQLVKVLTLLQPQNLQDTLFYIEEQKSLYEGYALICFTVIVTVFSYLALRETNRIAGPVYNLTTKMKAFRETGEKKEVAFRKGDHFADLQNEYNLLLKSVTPLEKIGIVEEAPVHPESDKDLVSGL